MSVCSASGHLPCHAGRRDVYIPENCVEVLHEVGRICAGDKGRIEDVLHGRREAAREGRVSEAFFEKRSHIAGRQAGGRHAETLADEVSEDIAHFGRVGRCL